MVWIFSVLVSTLILACDHSSNHQGGNSSESATIDGQPASTHIDGQAACLLIIDSQLALCSNIPTTAEASQLTQAKASCDPARGYQWQDQACPSEAVIAACDKNAGGRDFGPGVVQYYYNPAFTAADARGMCAANNGILL